MFVNLSQQQPEPTTTPTNTDDQTTQTTTEPYTPPPPKDYYMKVSFTWEDFVPDGDKGWIGIYAYIAHTSTVLDGATLPDYYGDSGQWIQCNDYTFTENEQITIRFSSERDTFAPLDWEDWDITVRSNFQESKPFAEEMDIYYNYPDVDPYGFIYVTFIEI